MPMTMHECTTGAAIGQLGTCEQGTGRGESVKAGVNALLSGLLDMWLFIYLILYLGEMTP